MSKKNSPLPLVLLGLTLTGIMASILLAYVYKQNRYISLQKSYHALLAQKSKLQSEVAGVELEIRNLKETGRLEDWAGKMGLAYRGVPELIVVRGRK